MEITREFLLKEQAHLEQQQMKNRQTMEQAKNDLEAAGGAIQLIAHLLKMLDEQKVETKEVQNEGQS